MLRAAVLFALPTSDLFVCLGHPTGHLSLARDFFARRFDRRVGTGQRIERLLRPLARWDSLDAYLITRTVTVGTVRKFCVTDLAWGPGLLLVPPGLDRVPDQQASLSPLADPALQETRAKC